MTMRNARGKFSFYSVGLTQLASLSISGESKCLVLSGNLLKEVKSWNYSLNSTLISRFIRVKSFFLSAVNKLSQT